MGPFFSSRYASIPEIVFFDFILSNVLKVPDSRIMLYAGDVDMACNFLGGEMFAEAMGLPVR